MSFNRTIYLALALVFAVSNTSFAQSKKLKPNFKKGGKTVCFPPNRLSLQDDLEAGNVTETQFNQIIDKIVEYYKPIVKAHGGDLVAFKNWKDGTVNAYANQNGKTWEIHMFGGLARRPEVTPDGFALVVCHELGHHLAGYPFYDDSEWASSEGQSDYFATHACAKAGWGGNKEKNLKSRKLVDPVAKEECDATYSKPEERALCYREADAGQSLADLLASLNSEKLPEFDTPDQSKVSRTDPSHPAAQCRLDTYFQGALCTKKFNENEIPGRDSRGGQDSAKAEVIASKTSCTTAEGFEVGYRPRCWFKPFSGKFRN
ncbi:MAG: hypothetical protein KA715_12995 [Xanthomonadaceae bacterium]|nr:hypothetical protein [Xanthomonadaceae bacterium]